MDKDLRAKIEAEIALVLPALTAVQEKWNGDLVEVTSATGEKSMTRRGKHLQCFPDGRGWKDLGMTLPNEPVAAYAVDEYVGPKGVGWVLRASVETPEGTWTRAINAGPETGFDAGWALLAEKEK